MKNGFTLVELLAIIIILSLLALITLPAIMGTVKDSEDKLNLKNVQLYINAVEKEVLKINLNESFKPSICSINTNGDLTCDDRIIKINEKGKKPTSGKIVFSSREVNYAILKYEDKEYTFTPSGNVIEGEICKLIDDADNSNSITPGDKYQCKVKEEMEQDFEDGYYFYVLSHNEDGTTNLIMDRNICEDGTLTEEGKTCLVAWNNESGQKTCAYGPVTAMTYLHNATKSWINIPSLNYTYNDKTFQGPEAENISYISFVSSNGIATITAQDGTTTTIGSKTEPLKSRMPIYTDNSTNSLKNEVANFNNNNVYLYEYLGEAWSYGESTKPENNISGIYGYWTLSSTYFHSFNNYSYSVWASGEVYYGDPVYEHSLYGVRPVINILF